MDLEDDHSIYILLSMKRVKDACHQRSEGCTLSFCLICSKGVPLSLHQSPTWPSILRVVFYSLKHNQSHNDYFNLRTDVYPFMESHWNMLCLKKNHNLNWKKQVQDVLSHYKAHFASGSGLFKQNGFWKLNDYEYNPWEVKAGRNHKLNPKQTRRIAASITGDSEEEVPRKKIKPWFNFEESLVPTFNDKGFLNEYQNLKKEIGLVKDCMHSMKRELKYQMNSYEIDQPSEVLNSSLSSPEDIPCVPDNTPDLSHSQEGDSPPTSPSSSLSLPPYHNKRKQIEVPQVDPLLDTFITSTVVSRLQVVPQSHPLYCEN